MNHGKGVNESKCIDTTDTTVAVCTDTTVAVCIDTTPFRD